MNAMVCSQCGAGLIGAATQCAYCGTAFERERAAAPRQHDCPRCHIPLAPNMVAQTHVGHCRRCAGLWVAHDAMHRLLALKKKQARKVAALNDAAGKPGQFQRQRRLRPTRSDAAPARCPACHHTMRLEPATRNHAVYIDICDDHGTWFDRSELATLADRYARDTLRRSAGGRAARYRSYDGDARMNIGAGMYLLGAVVELIGDVLD